MSYPTYAEHPPQPPHAQPLHPIQEGHGYPQYGQPYGQSPPQGYGYSQPQQSQVQVVSQSPGYPGPQGPQFANPAFDGPAVGYPAPPTQHQQLMPVPQGYYPPQSTPSLVPGSQQQLPIPPHVRSDSHVSRHSTDSKRSKRSSLSGRERLTHEKAIGLKKPTMTDSVLAMWNAIRGAFDRRR